MSVPSPRGRFGVDRPLWQMGNASARDIRRPLAHRGKCARDRCDRGASAEDVVPRVVEGDPPVALQLVRAEEAPGTREADGAEVGGADDLGVELQPTIEPSGLP